MKPRILAAIWAMQLAFFVIAVFSMIPLWQIGYPDGLRPDRVYWRQPTTFWTCAVSEIKSGKAHTVYPLRTSIASVVLFGVPLVLGFVVYRKGTWHIALNEESDYADGPTGVTTDGRIRADGS